jgi:hypothetical protein
VKSWRTCHHHHMEWQLKRLFYIVSCYPYPLLLHYPSCQTPIPLHVCACMACVCWGNLRTREGYSTEYYLQLRS